MFFIIIEKNDEAKFNHPGMRTLFDLIKIENIKEKIIEFLKDKDDCKYYDSLINVNDIIIRFFSKQHLYIYKGLNKDNDLSIQTNSLFDLIEKWKQHNNDLNTEIIIIRFNGLEFEFNEIDKDKKEKIINEEKDKFYYIQYNIEFEKYWANYINSNYFNLYILYDLFEDLFLLYTLDDDTNLKKIIAREIGYEIGLFKVGIKILDQNLLLIYNYSYEEDSIVISIDSLLKLIERDKEIANEQNLRSYKMIKIAYYDYSVDVCVEFNEI